MRPYVAVVMVSHKDIITGLFISFMEPVTHFISLRGLFFIRFSLYFIRLWIELIRDFFSISWINLQSWTDTPYFHGQAHPIFHVKWRTISIFQQFFASINNIFILGERLGTRL